MGSISQFKLVIGITGHRRAVVNEVKEGALKLMKEEEKGERDGEHWGLIILFF